MGRLKGAALALVLATPAFAQQQPSAVTNMQFASTPLNGSELLYVVQNGNPRKTTVASLSFSEVNNLLSGNNTWTGTNTFIGPVARLNLSGLSVCDLTCSNTGVAPVPAGQAFVLSGVVLIAQ